MPSTEQQISSIAQNSASTTDLVIANESPASLQKLPNGLRNNIYLKTLFFRSASLESEEFIDVINAISDNRQSAITDFTIENNPSSDEMMQAIAKLLAVKKAGPLTYLRLSNVGITAQDAEILANGLRSNTSLQSFSIPNNKIGDVGTNAIAKILEFNTSLNSLYLRNNEISDNGLLALGDALAPNSSLQKLDIQGNNFSIQAFSEFARKTQNNLTLTSLEISVGNLNISIEGQQNRNPKTVEEVMADLARNRSLRGIINIESNIATVLDRNKKLSANFNALEKAVQQISGLLTWDEATEVQYIDKVNALIKAITKITQQAQTLGVTNLLENNTLYKKATSLLIATYATAALHAPEPSPVMQQRSEVSVDEILKMLHEPRPTPNLLPLRALPASTVLAIAEQIFIFKREDETLEQNIQRFEKCQKLIKASATTDANGELVDENLKLLLQMVESDLKLLNKFANIEKGLSNPSYNETEQNQFSRLQIYLEILAGSNSRHAASLKEPLEKELVACVKKLFNGGARLENENDGQYNDRLYDYQHTLALVKELGAPSQENQALSDTINRELRGQAATQRMAKK